MINILFWWAKVIQVYNFDKNYFQLLYWVITLVAIFYNKNFLCIFSEVVH